MRSRMFWRLVFVSVLLLVPLSIFIAPGAVAAVFSAVVFAAPVWVPFTLAMLLAPLWLTYVRSLYVFQVPYTTLELKPGENTPKSAQAMELVFYSLHHRANIPRARELLFGEIRLPWSFEIAATNGTVRFFMRIPKSHRRAVELRLSAEYRDLDIDEVRDHARLMRFDPVSMKLVAREYALAKPDPYPLKTYVAYESEAKPRDPFQEILERLVAFGKGEHCVISFIVRPHHRERKHIWSRVMDTLHTDAHEEIAKILGSERELEALPEGKQRLIREIETALKKPSFDCGIRAVYFAKHGTFNEERAGMLDTFLDPFADATLNAFEARNPKPRVGWPLSDLFAAVPWLADMYQHNLFRRRAYFAPPYRGEPFILNTAELATVYHLPHITRASPLSRGTGKRLEPPENLPLAVA